MKTFYSIRSTVSIVSQLFVQYILLNKQPSLVITIIFTFLSLWLILSCGHVLSSGKITKVVVEIGDCKKYCEEGINEAKACGDLAMLAQVTMQKVLLNLTEGIDLSETIPVLEVRTGWHRLSPDLIM